MELTLTRHTYNERCTLGTLEVGDLKLFTVEKPQVANPNGPGGMPKISCIDEGQYSVMPHDSEKFPGTYRLQNTQRGVYSWPDDIPVGQKWGRSAILLHKGNSAIDVIGCIAIGTHPAADGVAGSGNALLALRNLLGHTETHRLMIENAAP